GSAFESNKAEECEDDSLSKSGGFHSYQVELQAIGERTAADKEDDRENGDHSHRCHLQRQHGAGGKLHVFPGDGGTEHGVDGHHSDESAASRYADTKSLQQ